MDKTDDTIANLQRQHDMIADEFGVLQRDLCKLERRVAAIELGASAIRANDMPSDDEVRTLRGRFRGAYPGNIDEDDGYKLCNRALGILVSGPLAFMTKDEARAIVARMVAGKLP